MLGLNHFRILMRLGCGEVVFTYLIMDKAPLASRKKLMRAQTEREITLDHPFLSTLYTHFETEKLSCLVMELCPGGDLHAMRQRQPGKRFSENAARFYVAEHMLGIVYRNLKPDNVLVREDGHVMLSDFDLSLTCGVCPTLRKSSKSSYYSQPAEKKTKPNTEVFHHITARPELIAEPTYARAVDWWMFGIFLYEILYEKTSFKESGNCATLLNVLGQPLRFPETPTVSFAMNYLIKGLLVMDPQHRLAHRRGATEIRQYPFFQTVNWALHVYLFQSLI
ncbi:hypothetical protein MKW98_019496 [Papaver atlanticum]|uniref:non-specific serine/threonine protein kinase n=1 Tax=Papaver atlanticum TaxID=357466 RepID=A0AAD4S8F3_9MAGN|nr:hypothetical protein MKW98_019496 [Papaver atlanticum]